MGMLRLLLALSVVIVHSRPIFGYRITMDSVSGATVAVQTFFIISGFYMALILNGKYVGRGAYGLFISNRFLRIFPVYWFVLALTIAFSFIAYLLFDKGLSLYYFIDNYQFLNVKTLAILLFSNICIFGQEVIFLLGLDTNKGSLFFAEYYYYTNPQLWKCLLVPQAWTISIELIFYLLAPLLVRRRLWILLTVIVASLLLRTFLYVRLDMESDPWIYRLFFTQIAFFMAGAVSYKFYTALKKRPPSVGFGAAATVLLLGTTALYQYIPGAAVKHWCFYLLVTAAIPFVFFYTKNLKADRYIGELSYPIYISHVLVLLCIQPLINKFQLDTHQGLLTVVCSILFSMVLIKFVINPIEQYRQRRVATG